MPHQLHLPVVNNLKRSRRCAVAKGEKMPRRMIKLLMCALLCVLPAAGAWADGAVYAMTNALNSDGGNHILVYHRANDGTLTLMQTIATGGGGSGLQLSAPDSLGSQGALVLDEGHHRLFAVNTETLAANSHDCQEGTITSFLVADDGSLTVADRVMSGGLFPNSLAVKNTKYGDLLYVLNAGGPGLSPACGVSPNITGFTVDRAGRLGALSRFSTSAINPGPTAGTGSGVNCPPGGFSPPASFYCGLNPPAFPRSPGQVGFTPDGNQLIVTVKGTNSIYVFPVGNRGTLGSPAITQAPGPALPTYFGFAFDKRQQMIVAEAFGRSPSIPAAGAGAVSSFAVTRSGALYQISASIADFGTAACWVALDPTTGRHAYISNNLSNTISTYSAAANGRLSLLAANAAAANGPNDLAVVGAGGASFLYVIEAGGGTVGAFRINLRNGSLTALPAVGGLPVSDGAAGLAAY
jgi:6-phosphogluconolactonase